MEEDLKLGKEKSRIADATAALPSDEDLLKGHLASSEKLLEGEHARKASIEARLLNIAGLVSIAGTVVLGALFSLASEKLSLESVLGRNALVLGCLYLAVQVVAALHSSVRGLQATGYYEDQPHALLPEVGSKQTVFLRGRIEQILMRVAEHRRVTDKKLDQLKVAHCALRNFLWGLLVVAIVSGAVAFLRTPSAMPCTNGIACVAGAPGGPGAIDGGRRLRDETGSATPGSIGLPVALISGGMSFVVLGIALVAIGGTWIRRAVGLAMVVGGLNMSLTGIGKLDATLFKIDKLIGDLRIELSLGSTVRPQQTFVRRVLTVGPFPDGDHLLAREQISRCVELAMARYKGLSIGGWEVVGRVDKRQLMVERAAIYGSNQALAMSRANWVAQQVLVSLPSFDLSHAIISVGGARGVGAAVGMSDLQSDRAVDVFAIVNARPGEAGSADLPQAVICPRVSP